MSKSSEMLGRFLLARIAEDEAVAKFPRPEVAAQSAHILAEESATVRLAHPPRPGLAGAMEEGCRALRSHHPTRLLAECEAKRRIVEHCGIDYLVLSPGDPYVLQLLALPYADHPEYREEWKP